MGQAQDFAIKFMGIALMFAGILCVVKGGFSVHKNNGGNDDINLAGWKSISSWWALGGIILAGGSYMTFMQFINGIFNYLIHG
jgi:hypothetical protein